jgi:hypothetical protein
VQKTGEVTGCAFCSLEGVQITESKFVHSDLKKKRFSRKQFVGKKK